VLYDTKRESTTALTAETVDEDYDDSSLNDDVGFNDNTITNFCGNGYCIISTIEISPIFADGHGPMIGYPTMDGDDKMLYLDTLVNSGDTLTMEGSDKVSADLQNYIEEFFDSIQDNPEQTLIHSLFMNFANQCNSSIAHV
jgi:hypothetical protein